MTITMLINQQMGSFDTASVSNSILNRSFAEGVPISLMKLQRILYFAASEYYKKSGGRALLGELFQPWQYGPVLGSTYFQFKAYGEKPIRRYAKDAKGKAFVIDEAAHPILSSTLSDVWVNTREYSAVTLSRITQIEGSAWWSAWQNEQRYIEDDAVGTDVTYIRLLGLDRATHSLVAG